MKSRYWFFCMAVAGVFIIVSCTTAVNIPETNTAKPDKEIQEVVTDKSEYLTISEPYTLRSLLLPVIQMNEFAMSVDYFDQFVEYNDYIFPDYLFRILGMELDNYNEAQGTTLSGNASGNDFQFVFEKALLSSSKDESWRRFRVNYTGRELLLEILSNEYKVPQKIRFIDSETGLKHEVIPDIATDFERALNEVSGDQLKAGIEERTGKNIDERMSFLFTSPKIILEEKISTPAGDFMTVLVRDSRDQNDWIDYWLSPDVPGGIVRISYTSNGETDMNVTELTAINNNVSQEIAEHEITALFSNGFSDGFEGRMESGFSEGSPGAAIQLYSDEIYYGSVGDGGSSYYKYTVDYRSDISIEIEEMTGIGELLYFGTDSSFSDWISGSEGNSLGLQDYMVRDGETIYFSINDVADEYSVGENYSIQIYQSAILDPIGIMMKGDIYSEAAELKSGENHTLQLGENGLDYYQTTVTHGNTLKIIINSEPDSGSLVWFDTKGGSYYSMNSEEGPEGRIFTIDGLSRGTVCYYYFSSDQRFFDPLEKLELTITEF